MKRKMLRSSLSAFLAAIMFFSMMFVPAQAAGTSTAARIYSDFADSPAFKNFETFASLYIPECATPIPGLGNTDVNGVDCATMVPQNVCFAGDYLMIAAYDSNSLCNSVLYVISGETQSFLTALVLPIMGKTGGIAFDGKSLWVANGKKISGISYSALDTAVQSALAGNMQSISIKFDSHCAVAIKPSFLTYGDGMLWAGEYKGKGDSSGKLYGYAVSADCKKLVKHYSISIPDRVRGVSIHDGYLFLTRSESRNVSSSDYVSQLRVYELSQPDADGIMKKISAVKTVELPPIAEGLAVNGEYLYLVFSSGATVYYKGSDGGGKCKYPVDRLIPFALSDILGSYEPTTPDAEVSATVTLDTTSATVVPGTEMTLTASFSDGSVSWKSSNTGVITLRVVDEKTVKVNAVADGKATVTCTLSNGSVAKCVFVVVGSYFAPCDSRETSLADALLAQSYDHSLATQAKIAAANGMENYTGTVEENAVLLERMKAGLLINPGLSHVAMDLSGVSLSKTKLDMKFGQRYQLVASFPEGTVSWKSSNTKVVTVTSVDTDTVMLHAVAEGKATITCTLDNGKVAKCVIHVEYLYFEKCDPAQESIVRALQEQTFDPSFENRSLIAEVNGISNYQGTAEENEALLKLMMAGKLINPGLESYLSAEIPSAPDDSTGIYFPKCASAFESIVLALQYLGYDSSFAFRAKIAEANGIENYSGTAEQNVQMLDLLKAGKLVKPDVVLASNERLVCFNANGGEGDMAEIVFVNGDALPANIFTKKGYKFSGWATSASGDVAYNDCEIVTLDASLTLYAVWQPIQYIVRYHANGGEGTMEDTIITYGVDSTLRTPAFTQEGYTLTGWYRYRTSDNKWMYKSEDGSTNAWYLEGEQPAGYAKNVMKTTSSIAKTSSLDGDVVILYAVWKKGNGTSLDGKKVMFIGNSFIYYGGVVELGSQKKTDKGWFYDICKANGESTTVYDCTYGNHHLYDFTSSGCKSGSCHDGKDLLSGIDLKTIDFVFISESGNNNSNFVRDVKNVIKRFPSSTKFIYLSHSYSYIKNHTNITGKLGELQKLGVMVVEWGKLVDDVIDGRTKVSGATVKYTKNTFIKNKGDTHHPNPLAGYIAAQMAYCAVTGKSAVGQMPDVYENGKSVKYGQSVVGYSAFISKHYTSSTSSNFKTVMKSAADIKGLQKLMDTYLAKRGLGIDGNK